MCLSTDRKVSEILISFRASSRFVGVRVRSGLCIEALGSAHRSSPPISHAIRSSDQLAMLRKQRNFNDVDSKFERGVGELHAKFGGGVLPEVSGCQGFRVTIEPQADGPQAACCQEFRVLELCAA